MKARLAFLFAIALLPAMLLMGCGENPVSSSVIDTTPPLAPVIEGAGAEKGAATVWWSPNAEADLAGYHVYVVENRTAHRVNSFPTDRTYMAVPVDAAGTVSVYVTAVDLNGNESGPSDARPVHLEGDVLERIDGVGIGVEKFVD